MELVILIIALIVICVVGFIVMGNSLMAKKNRVEKAWADIDIYLQKRFDEMEPLLEQAGMAVAAESKMYHAIAKARSGITEAQTPADKLHAESQVRTVIGMMNGRWLQENYPEMKSLQQIAYTMSQTTANERDIAAIRKIYNSNLTDYYNALEMWPTSTIAKMKGLHKGDYEFWKLEDKQARKRPRTSQALSRGAAVTQGKVNYYEDANVDDEEY